MYTRAARRGESITFANTTGSDGHATYTWTVDGIAQAPTSSSDTMTTSFSTAGNHTVGVEVKATLSDGRELSYNLKSRCQAVVIGGKVPRSQWKPRTVCR